MELTLADVIPWAIAIITTIVTFLKKESFFKGQHSVKSERIDKDLGQLQELVFKVQRLEHSVQVVEKSINTLAIDQEEIENRYRTVEKVFGIQETKLANFEKLFEKVVTQHDNFQKNLVESNQAIHSLKVSLDNVHTLLERIVDGRLIIKRE